MATEGQFDGGLVGLYVNSQLIGCTTSDNFDGTANQIDASCKGSGLWGTFLAGTKNWTITSEGRWQFDAAFGVGDLFDLWHDSTEVTLVYQTNESGDWYLEGTAEITNISLTAPNNDAAGFSVTFSGKGEIVRKTET